MATKTGEKQRQNGITTADTEVTPPASRKKRHLTAAYKLRVLDEIEALPYGGIGAYLRREGLYSSQIATWRRQREVGQLAALDRQKPGPKVDETTQRLVELERENEQLRSQLAQAEVIIAVQKKTGADFRKHCPKQWREIVTPYIQEMAPQVPISVACTALGLPRSQYY